MKIIAGDNNFIRLTLAVALCFALLSSCATFEEHKLDTFQAEEISCEIHFIPELRKMMDNINANPYGDLYLMAKKDEILADLKKLADEGDPEAMFLFGAIKREALEVELIHGKNGSFVKRPFPDDTKNDIITATTYIYLSAGFESQKKKTAQQLIQKIEENDSTLTTLPEWIAEAKSNAERWKVHCAQTDHKHSTNQSIGRNVAARLPSVALAKEGDIALAFGVPAQLVGIPDAQT